MGPMQMHFRNLKKGSALPKKTGNNNETPQTVIVKKVSKRYQLNDWPKGQLLHTNVGGGGGVWGMLSLVHF